VNHGAVDAQLEPGRCIECGRELLDVEPGDEEPTRCEDCLPETGPGSPFADRLSINLRQLRLNAGLSPAELAEAAGLHESTISGLEGEGGHDLRLVTALRLVGPLDVSVDQLVERIFWNPGQVTRGSKRPPSERLTGFFLVVPGNVPVFDPAPSREPVTTRQEAAAILGANVREARERRHFTQRALGASSGVSKAGLSLIERGVRETSIKTLCGLAHSLEVPPDVLLQGIAWKPEPSKRQRSRARCPGRSRDDAIRRLWNEDRTAREIATALGTSPGTVSATVHRLRERGEHVHYRRPPTRAVHQRARGRRVACQSSPPSEPPADAPSAEPAGIDQASNKEVARRIGENVAKRRAEAGLSLRELEEAAETHFSHLARIEKGRTAVPQLALILKLAGSLNVRCSLLTAGVVWDAASGAFQVLEALPEPQTALGCLGENARHARYRLDLSQQALSDIASMSRGDLVDFERGSRNFRIFTVIRLAGALGVSFAELFSSVANWHTRPLAPPEFLPGEAPTKAERDQLLIRLWKEGRPEGEIAEVLDLSRNSVGPYVRDLRDTGEGLPYRRAPRTSMEVAARHRRGVCLNDRKRLPSGVVRRPRTPVPPRPSTR
jgi:transcriptional regulator with XRE-family HTH domain